MKKKELIMFNKHDKTKILKELNEEITTDHKTKLKLIIKEKMKNIRRTEILLEKQREELNQILDGKLIKTEEELLFNE